MQIPNDTDFRKFVKESCRKFDKTYYKLGGLAEYTNLQNYMAKKSLSIPLASAQKVIDAVERLEERAAKT